MKKNPHRIFLVGSMGSGKTFWGEKIAARLNFSFIDYDRFLEEKAALNIPEIFRRQGESYFRELEKKYLDELSNFEKAVIAMGGGTPCFFDNMKKLNIMGFTIYLQSDPETLARRVGAELQHRPLLKDIPADELHEFFKNQLHVRETFYLQAHHVVKVEEISEANMNEKFLLHQFL